MEQIGDTAELALHLENPVVQWMIGWSAMLISRFSIGRDGRTAFERRKCKIPVAPLRMDGRSLARAFENFAGVVRAVKRMNEDERCDSELLKKMKGTPQQLIEPVPQEPLR